MESLVGRTINNYQILLRIRETGISVLYRAYDIKLQKNVAFDIIKSPPGHLTGLFSVIETQVIRLKNIHHSNIADVLKCEIYEDFIYCVYDFSPYLPFRRAFQQTYTWKVTSQELVSISHALVYAHDMGCFHGSLYPDNFVVNDQRIPYIFGLGIENCVINYLIKNTPGGWVYNSSFEYLAPELLEKMEMDARTDVYGFGTIIFEWITGFPFIEEENALLALLKLKNEGFIKNRFKNTFPKKLIRLMIKKCLEINPNKRYQSITPVNILLTRGALDFPITLEQLKKPTLQNKKKFHWWLTLVPSIILILLGGLIGQYYFPSNGYFYLSQDSPNAHFFETPTSTPDPKLILKSQTPTKFATKIRITPTQEELITPTPLPSFIQNKAIHTLFENQNIPSDSAIITSDNAHRIVPISVWGIGKINYLATSPDNQYLAISTSYGLFIYSLPELDLINILDNQAPYQHLIFSPDGKYLSASDGEGLIHVFSVANWSEYRLLSGHTNYVIDQVFSNDSNYLISLPKIGNAWLWNIDDKSGQMLSSSRIPGSNEDLTIRDLLQKETLPENISFNLTIPNTHVFVSNNKNILILKDTSYKVPLFQMLGAVTDVKLSPDGTMIAAIDHLGFIKVVSNEKEILWTSKIIESDQTTKETNFKLVFTADNQYIIAAGSSGLVRIFRSSTGDQVFSEHLLANCVQNIRQSNDGEMILTQLQDGIVRIWNYKNGKEITHIPGYIMPGKTFSIDDRYIALRINNSTINVYNTTTFDVIYSFENQQNIKTISFANRSLLAIGNSHDLRLWSIISGQEVKTTKNFNKCTIIYNLEENPLEYITQYDHVVQLSTNTNLLCSFVKANWMKAIEIDENINFIGVGGTSKLEIHKNSGTIDILTGLRGMDVIDIAFSPDGNLVAASLNDNSINIWNISSQDLLIRLIGHTELIEDLLFSKDGKFLISGSLDGNVRIWGIP
jgi:WD40 repeat protein